MNTTISKKTIVAAFSLSILAMLPNCGGGCCGKKEAVVTPEKRIELVEEQIEKSVDALGANIKDGVQELKEAVLQAKKVTQDDK